MNLPTKMQFKPIDENSDSLALIGTDFIELYVGNALQSAYYYKAAFGFQSLAYSGLSTGNDLGILGSLPALPQQAEQKRIFEIGAVKALFDLPKEDQEEAFHRLAQKILRNGDPQTALSILFLSDEHKLAP